MNITLERLTQDNYIYAEGINREDISEDWVDTAATIMEINEYGREHNYIGHTFLARLEEKYVGLILVIYDSRIKQYGQREKRQIGRT